MEGHAGGVISSLAGMPEFLRRPILKRRVAEYFASGPAERAEVVEGALAAGPGIPFGRFEGLFSAWLDVMAEEPEERRRELFSAYMERLGEDPSPLAAFHADGLLGCLLRMDPGRRGALAATAAAVLESMRPEARRRLLAVVPDGARRIIGA